MQHYEIRILRPDGRTALITAANFWNDNAAICSAKKFARGRDFEVWRGMACVHSTSGPPHPEPLTPRPAA